MNLDWKLLVRVREQQRTRAQQRVAEERHATQRAQGQAQAAREAWSQEVQTQASLWQSLQGETQALDIAALRHASAWSRTLDGRIGQAAAMAAQAEGAAVQQAQRLADSRHALRGAAGALHKAEQMRDRVHDDRQRMQQQRADDTLEEAAVQAWQRRVAGR